MSDVGDIVILDVDKNELRSPFCDLESLPHELVRLFLFYVHYGVLYVSRLSVLDYVTLHFKSL